MSYMSTSPVHLRVNIYQAQLCRCLLRVTTTGVERNYNKRYTCTRSIVSNGMGEKVNESEVSKEDI
jgi:hypothetical protein